MSLRCITWKSFVDGLMKMWEATVLFLIYSMMITALLWQAPLISTLPKTVNVGVFACLLLVSLLHCWHLLSWDIANQSHVGSPELYSISVMSSKTYWKYSCNPMES